MSYGSSDYYGWAPRKTVAQRRADAARALKDASRRGRAMSPVVIAGRKIADTFWGKAWCDNLERYRDFAYRLDRGRSYVRSGSVLDLKIETGKIAAVVSGSSLYDVSIEIDAVKRDAWRAIQKDCAGGIGSRIDLLGGQLTEPVMARLCADRTGLFPHPSAIRFTCSCPDYATMCKHIAAAMYGVGARLDREPELLFTLRRVSLDELLASAVSELPATPSAGRVLAARGLASLFGIELAEAAAPAAGKPAAHDRASRTRATGVATSEVSAVLRGSAAAPVVTGKGKRRTRRAASDLPAKSRGSATVPVVTGKGKRRTRRAASEVSAVPSGSAAAPVATPKGKRRARRAASDLPAKSRGSATVPVVTGKAKRLTSPLLRSRMPQR